MALLDCRASGSAISYSAYVFPDKWVNSFFHQWYIPIAMLNTVICTAIACYSRYNENISFTRLILNLAVQCHLTAGWGLSLSSVCSSWVMGVFSLGTSSIQRYAGSYVNWCTTGVNVSVNGLATFPWCTRASCPLAAGIDPVAHFNVLSRICMTTCSR